MADLPQDIQRLAIPRDMDARYSGASARPAFDNADPIRVAEREAVKRVQQQDHEFSMSDTAGDAGRRTTNSGTSAEQTKLAAKADKERQNRTETQMLLSMLDQRIAQLDNEIAEYEAGFLAKFGDAWREEIAVRVLDEDEMPERHEGESMEDYRQRVEDAVVEKMIDPDTGKMRPEYANHPEFKEYGEWAEREFEQRNAKALANEIETASPERVAEINHEVRANDSFNQFDQIAQEFTELSPNNEGVETVKQASIETTGDLVSEDLDQQGLSLNEGGGMFGGMSPN